MDYKIFLKNRFWSEAEKTPYSPSFKKKLALRKSGRAIARKRKSIFHLTGLYLKTFRISDPWQGLYDVNILALTKPLKQGKIKS